jgi:uncharacterized protein YyaL (SSP411 family)
MRALILAVVVAVACGQGAPKAPVDDGTGLPGAQALPDEVATRLRAAWDARPKGYVPRTRHLRPDGGPRYTNRLFLETSPYLLQHAHNPVDWHPWGDEAFEAARRLGRPVLLSVGYSTCHWCHVMEEESFEDEEIARYLNEHYVAIKVDREERPDVDAVYMNAVQTLTGRGGWPMTVWLTPERRPFYGGTYFPPRDGDRGVAVGFLTLLRKLRTTYDAEPARVVEAAASLADEVRKNLASAGAAGDPVGPALLHRAAALARERFDPVHGGTRGAPKFPGSFPVRFLLRYHRRTGDAEALRMATVTLEQMAAGGIRDHVGGGFHRYSTDDRWLVPHFEKMLYDNALLALAYLEGYQATGRADFADVAREILRYVARDMTSDDLAFFSATDADSRAPDGERREGWFFTWTPAEIEAVLGAEDARLVAAYYAVGPEGSFEGRSILHAPRPLEAVARDVGRAPGDLATALASARERLYAARAKRPPPLRDEKILAAWNGLMISAYARAAVVLGDPEYAESAKEAAEFVLAAMHRDGRIFRSWKDGRLHRAGYLDDYAFLIAGLLDLQDATGELVWFQHAIALDDVLAAHFEDREAGGFFTTSDDGEPLLAREKPAYDGAEPSGNSVHALNLLRLYELTGKESYRRRALGTIGALGGRLAADPTALGELLLAVDWQLDAPKEIVIATPRSRDQAAPFLAELRRHFVPNRVVLLVAPDDDDQNTLVPLIEGKGALGGRPTAYVCENRVCDLPTSDPAVFARQIAAVRPLARD